MKELIEDQGECWKKQLFSPQEAQQILQIPISRFGAKDQLVWNLENHGIFTVSSSYKMAQQEKEWRKAGAETSHAREIIRECEGSNGSCQLNLNLCTFCLNVSTTGFLLMMLSKDDGWLLIKFVEYVK